LANPPEQFPAGTSTNRITSHISRRPDSAQPVPPV